jgi:hypothetical protein
MTVEARSEGAPANATRDGGVGGPCISASNPRAVYCDHVEGKRLVYLDTNVYIELRHAKTLDARACLAACRSAKASRRVLFPLSYALFSELLEQRRSKGLIARGALMDELSEGVSFRGTQQVCDIEARAAFPMLFGKPAREPDRRELFTYVGNCLGDWFLTFPSFPLNRNDDVPTLLMALLRSSGALNSVSWWLVNHDLDAHRVGHGNILSRHRQQSAESYARAAECARNPDGKLNKRKALLQEQLTIFKMRVLPALSKLLLEGLPADEAGALLFKAQRALGEGSEERLCEFMRAMPATGLCSEVHAMRVMNPSRRYRDEDFWDVENAAVPPAYVDAFVTRDGELANILSLARRLQVDAVAASSPP